MAQMFCANLGEISSAHCVTDSQPLIVRVDDSVEVPVSTNMHCELCEEYEIGMQRRQINSAIMGRAQSKVKRGTPNTIMYQL